VAELAQVGAEMNLAVAFLAIYPNHFANVEQGRSISTSAPIDRCAPRAGDGVALIRISPVCDEDISTSSRSAFITVLTIIVAPGVLVVFGSSAGKFGQVRLGALLVGVDLRRLMYFGASIR